MKKSDTFINCEVINYNMLVGGIDFILTDVEDIDELVYLQNLGFDISISKGKVNLHPHELAIEKLLASEIEDVIAEDNYNVRDYIDFHCWNEDLLQKEITLAIREAKVEYATKIDISILDVFEYIVATWNLTEEQTKQLREQEADEYETQRHPDERKFYSIL